MAIVAVASLAAIGTAGAVTVGSAAAATTSSLVKVAAQADTYVSTGSPYSQFSASTQLMASSIPGHVKTAFVRFDIPALNGGQITGADLVLTRSDHHLAAPVQAHAVASLWWVSSQTTARHAPAVGAVVASQATTASMSTVSMNVLSAVHGSRVTIALTSSSTTNWVAFRSRQWGVGAPQLQLTVRAPAVITPPTPPTVPPPAATCVGNAKGIPSSGAYAGAAVGGTQNVSGLESSVSSSLPIHRTYYNADQVAYALATVHADLAAHRLPWISFKLPYSWADMAAGRGDSWAVSLSDALAKVGGPVWLAFHHEPEGDGYMPDWTRMQQHLAPIVHAHAANVAFTVILIAWDSYYGPAEYALDKVWPGSQYVDILGMDLYNSYGAKATTKSTLDPMNYFDRIGPWARAHGVKWALAETGYTSKANQEDPSWLQTEWSDLRLQGGLALTYFDSSYNSIADWTLSDSARMAAFKTVVQASARIC